MTKNLRLAAATLVLSLVGCRPPAATQTPSAKTVPTVIREPTDAPTETVVRQSDCRETAQYFHAEFPSRFESVDGAVEWCRECIAEDGVPTMSYDIGPFCNPKTSDAGRSCTDSNQCEGVCLSEDEASESGRCSDTERVIGCVFEMTDGRSLERCFD